MKRILAATLFALTAASAAQAQDFGCPVPAAGGPPNSGWQLGCPGCFRFLGLLHQHGPLVNYGPYAGYYPFEPYGPWNAQLQYTGPTGDPIGYGWCHKCGSKSGHGHCSSCESTRKRFSLFSRKDSGEWGNYASTTFQNVSRRVNPLANWSCGKSSCSASAAEATTPATELKQESPIQPTSYPRRER